MAAAGVIAAILGATGRRPGAGSVSSRETEPITPYTQLVWLVRWLAADPSAGLAALPDPRIVPDDLANSLDGWLHSMSHLEPLKTGVRERLEEIDAAFDVMSDAPGLWTPEAFARSPEWAAQRVRARDLLALLGEARADDALHFHV